MKTLVKRLLIVVGLMTCFCSSALAQTAAPVAAPAAAAPAVEQLTGTAATVDNIAKAVAPSLPWDTINSAIIGLVLISRIILKYFLPANPTPGGLADKASKLLAHTGGVIT